MVLYCTILTLEAVVRVCSVEKVFLEISQNSQENTCARGSFLIKLQASGHVTKKESLAQALSCEFCEISKNTFPTEHTRITAFVTLLLLFFLWRSVAIAL